MQTTSQETLVAQLQAENAWLKRENQRKDKVIAQKDTALEAKDRIIHMLEVEYQWVMGIVFNRSYTPPGISRLYTRGTNAFTLMTTLILPSYQ